MRAALQEMVPETSDDPLYYIAFPVVWSNKKVAMARTVPLIYTDGRFQPVDRTTAAT
jgi:hypothetical protein